jgi:hypothetical protein
MNIHYLTFPFVLQQVFPKAELEQHLAGRLKFHAEHREALRTALKTYLNDDQPVPDDVGWGDASAQLLFWLGMTQLMRTDMVWMATRDHELQHAM